MSDLVAKELVKQTIKGTRYKYAFLSLLFAIAVVMVYLFLISSILNREDGASAPHVAIVRVNGAIMEDRDASAKNVIQNLRDAVENKNSVGVVISINSPGGSPIQAERIYDEIIRISNENKEKKIIAVINEIGASAAYYIASSAPVIYASRASLVGSIGVTGSGFGFTGVMDKIGVERRVYASGEHKLFLDPFSPKNSVEAEFFKKVLKKVHSDFISKVEAGRSGRIKDDAKVDLYSGLIWDGATAKDKGLIDKIGTIDIAIEKEFDVDDVYVYQQPEPLLKSLGGIIGATIYNSISENMLFKGLMM